MTFGKILRRFFLDVGIAIAVLVLVFLAVLLLPARILDFSGQWLALVVCTGLLLWVTIRESGLYLRRPAFWFVTACLLAVHFLIFVAIFYAFPPLRFKWYMTITCVEVGAFGAILSLLFNGQQHRHPRRGRESTGNL